MVVSGAPCLYTEARLNLDPASPDSIITINLSPKEAPPTLRGDHDETTFTAEHIASEASVYFAPKASYPRSILWRILDWRRTIELQAVDCTQDRRHKRDPSYILRLVFPHQIRENCVALTGSRDDDGFSIFVVTANNELHTIDLRKDLLANPEAAEHRIKDGYKSFFPSSFSFRYPHRLYASSSHELLIALHDGGLMRLERGEVGDDSRWRERFFSEGGWGSMLLGLVPWKGHNTVRAGDLDLEADAAASIVTSPDGKHVFTVCFNHTLKAWNLKTGKVGINTDLLGENDRDAQKMAQYLLRPSSSNLMQVIEKEADQEMDEYILATYSPKGHEFKFWEIRDADDTVEGIRDLHEGFRLVPPFEDLLDTTVWTLEEFRIKASPRGRHMELWALVRCGAKCQLLALRFNLHDHSKDIEKAWNEGWIHVANVSLTPDVLKAHSQLPVNEVSEVFGSQPRSLTERWLDFLFFPGRFNRATLETSLFVFQRSLGRAITSASKTASKEEMSLMERISAAVMDQVFLEPTAQGQMNYERYETDLAKQWQIFFTVVKDLHRQREDVLSLSFDFTDGQPWLCLADFVSGIRKCSEIELLKFNGDFLIDNRASLGNDILYDALHDQHSERVATLLRASERFRNMFSTSVKVCMETVLNSETLQEHFESVSVRIQTFYDRCGFQGEITDDDYNRLTDDLRSIEGFSGLDSTIFGTAISRLGQGQHGHRQTALLTRYGAKLLVQGAQELLELGWNTLLDLLVLLVFMAVELEPEDLAAMEIDINEMYLAILTKLREVQVLRWLAGNVRREHRLRNAGSTDGSPTSKQDQSDSGDSGPVRTLLESMFIGDWTDIRTPQEAQSTLMTYWIQAWTFGAPISERYDAIVPHIMADLLQHGDMHLAADFYRFLPSTAWATYVKARFHLLDCNFTQASSCFGQAAFGLAAGKYFDVEEYDRAGLISLDQRHLFNCGLASYYQHVLGLFEKAKALSYVADFAKLALQSCMAGSEESNEAQTEITLRLFSACLQTSRFDDAYSALMRYTDPALQKSALISLITAMITQHRTPRLFTYPFASLHPSLSVDAVLLSLCRKTRTATAAVASAGRRPPPPYHKILYAYRISRHDFRGAAEALWDRLQRLKGSWGGRRPKKAVAAARDGEREGEGGDVDDVLQCYLMIINVLACVDPAQAWILAEDEEGHKGQGATGAGDVFGGAGKGTGKGEEKGKRRVVTLEDVRAEYQRELDGMAMIENGRFALVGGPAGVAAREGGEEMDVL